MENKKKLNIRAKERNAIIDSLKMGIVPKVGLQHIQVGRNDEISEFIKDFENVREGGAKTRFIIGDFGAGKTFFLNLAKLLAHEHNLVVMNADLTVDCLLSGTEGQSRHLFSELVSNLSTKTRPNGNALEAIIESWASKILDELDNAEITTENLQKYLAPLNKFVNCYDFAKVLSFYINAYNDGNDVLIQKALRWLRAEYSTKTEARTELGVRNIIDDSNFYDYIKLYSSFVRLAGYDGIVVCIDELAVLARLRSQTRNKNFERLLNIINDSTSGSTENLEFIFGGTQEILRDENKGMFSYGALKSRLATNPFADATHKDLTGPVIELPNLTQEELMVLFFNIRNVFASYNESSYLVTNDEITNFMKWILNRLGARSYLSPRESVKTFVSLLTQLENYPGTKAADYLEGLGQMLTNEVQSEQVAEDHEDLLTLMLSN